MKTFLIAVCFLVSCSFASKAQVDSVYYGTQHESQKKPKNENARNDAWRENVTWGGNLQAWVGNPTFILLSPTIGYNLFKNFNVGVGGVYNYMSYDYGYGKYTQSIFGGDSYMRYTFIESYFVQAQFDRLLQPDFASLEPNDKTWVNYVLVGGGFRQSISDKAALSTSIMYCALPNSSNQLSIYPSRIIIQFGIMSTF